MGKATNAKRKAKTKTPTRVGPTVEQSQHGEYVSAGMAHRRVPMIDTLLTRGHITDKEYVALAHYRDQAHLAERSPTKSCLDQRVGGQGPDALPAVVISAMIETGRIERDLGQLLDIARAVAVEDKSLSQWCIEKYGSRERYNGKGEFVAIVPICERRHMDTARLELRMAARRIVK